MTLFPKNNTEKIAYENEQGENGRKENIFPRIRVSRSSRCEARGKIRKTRSEGKRTKKTEKQKIAKTFPVARHENFPHCFHEENVAFYEIL